MSITAASQLWADKIITARPASHRSHTVTARSAGIALHRSAGLFRWPIQFSGRDVNRRPSRRLLTQGLRDHHGEKLNPDAELVIDSKSEG
jgi:hypothetical protein